MKRLRLLIPIPILLLTAPALPAQEVLNWHDFELCNDCELEVTELVRLGDADGPGIIEGADVRVVWDEETRVPALSSPRIPASRSSTTTERSCGKSGERATGRANSAASAMSM